MHKMQEQVRQFHREILRGPTSPAEPMIRNGELRAALVVEEAIEMAVALIGADAAEKLVQARLEKVLRKNPDAQPDLIEAIDGCGDLLYVTYGTFEDIGIDAEPFTDEIHRSNMTKRDVHADQQQTQEPLGKAIKGPDWSPPDLAGVLANTTPPGRESCGCDGAIDDGCYNCNSERWACSLCCFPLIRHAGARTCLHCAGERRSAKEWSVIAFSGFDAVQLQSNQRRARCSRCGETRSIPVPMYKDICVWEKHADHDWQEITVEGAVVGPVEESRHA